MAVATTFGGLLRQLRKRAGMNQGDLAAALDYSVSFISSLERNKRLPDVDVVAQRFAAALGLQDEPRLAARLIELAAEARGERPPTPLTVHRGSQTLTVDERASIGVCLPAPPTELIGRKAEVRQLSNRFLGHRGRLLTLIGPPGVGKTRLALEVAAHLEPIYKDGACFVPLAAVQDPNLIPAAIAGALGIGVDGRKSPRVRLIETLRRQERLILLDNFEHLLAPTQPLGEDTSSQRSTAQAGQNADAEIQAVTLVFTLLNECPNLRLLVTSRERLHLRAEQRFSVQPLAMESAVDLFVRRAQDIDPEFSLSAPNRPIIEAICRCIDCLPLALELAAARMDLFSPNDLLHHLQEQRLVWLTDGPRDLPVHQRALRTAIDASYSFLSVKEQALFRALSVFVDGFDLMAAVHFGFEASNLEALLNKNLVYVDQARGAKHRFMMLETLREYGLEQLAAHGEMTLIRQQHADYFLAVAQTATAQMGEAERKIWLDRLEEEHNNLRTALRWLIDHNAESALDLAVMLRDFWYIRGYLPEARNWLMQALDQAQSPTLARGRGLTAAAVFVKVTGDGHGALRLTEESVAILSTQDDPAALAEAWRERGWAFFDLYDREQAISSFERSLAIFRSLDDETRVADVLGALAYAVARPGEDNRLPRAWLEEAIAIYRSSARLNGLVFVLNQLGALETLEGHYSRAEMRHREALACARQVDARLDMTKSLELLGEVRWLQGDVAAANRYWQEGHILAQALGEQELIMLSWHHLGQVARRQGNLGQASHCYQQSLQLCRTLGNEHMTIRCLIGLGGVALASGDYEQAARLLTSVHPFLTQLPSFLAPADQNEYLAMIETTRHALDTTTYARLQNEGRMASLENVAWLALTHTPTV